jgi:hypothetical protein
MRWRSLSRWMSDSSFMSALKVMARKSAVQDCLPISDQKLVPSRHSLIREENSLMRAINSLLGQKKFPVPLRREFAEKMLYFPRCSGCSRRRNGPELQKFPVLSLFNREYHAETSSRETARTATN